MKQFTMVLFLLAILPFSYLVDTQLAFAQKKTTATAVMTLASASNNDTSLNTQSIENKTVNYHDNTTGYLAYPSTIQGNEEKKLPAVVMIHENKGLNDYIKDSANILAQQGYVVLAVDLFNGEVTSDQNRSRELTSIIRDNPDVALENMKSAVSYLGTLENVNASRLASLGWCFGGAQSLQLALNSEENPLAASIIYYGRLTNDTQALSNIKGPILGIFGGEDQSISNDSVKQFEQDLNNLGITNEVYIYPNVGHAFANPSNDNYAPNETADAWKNTLEFLKKHV
ncbi:MAG: dienelactone hydrolase family protein [Nitrosopumilus sp.]|nr:dienelactone hydrolase family protein [Nitrosopumilus sp.]